MSKRFVLRIRGGRAVAPRDIERLQEVPSASLVDQTSKMLYVEAPDESQEQLAKAFPGWLVSEEVGYTLPDPRIEPK